MLIRELTQDECREVLGRASIARLASAFDNQPYVLPIHVQLDGDHLYSFATLGQKIEWMRANPKVCLEVEEVADRFRWTTVLVFGRYQELVHTDHYEQFRARARELFRDRPAWWQPAASQPDQQDARMPVLYRIHIGRLTGRIASGGDPASGQDAAADPWWLRLLFEPGRDPRG